jgi:mannose-6-phosphate isomerase-like protein (cupin superfamily)
MKTRRADIAAYETRDGSEIRELMHPAQHGNRLQSLAEATVPRGTRTRLHQHHQTEELYYILTGSGQMTLGAEQFMVEPGDTVLIPPGTAHCIEADSVEAITMLCCCSPAYSHDDTELL